MNISASVSFATGTIFLAATAGFAADWPQFRGPNLDSTTTEKISSHWSAAGPKQLWKVPTTDGFSSFVVSGGKAFTVVRRTVETVPWEVCVALDANTGKGLWATPVGLSKYDTEEGNSGAPDNKGGDGPRTTPSVDGNRVYVMSGHLALHCLDAATGKEVWKHDLKEEFAGREVRWQNAASPLIEGGLVLVNGGGAGQSIIAFDKATGKVAWKAHDEKLTHSTPTAATIHGTRQVIFFTGAGLVSIAPQTGALLWKFPFPMKVSTAMTPVVSGDIVFCSAGYGAGSAAAKVSKNGDAWSAEELWRQPANVLNNHWSTPVLKDGHLYGLFGFKEYGKCPLKCVEIATGKIIWSQEGFGPGGCVLAGGQLVVLGDSGQVVLVDPNPKGYSELARASVITGKCWSTPVVANGRIYARSTKEGVCLDVSTKSAGAN